MPPVAPIDYDCLFQKHLRRGETLLWVGRPRQGLLFRRTDWVAVPFSAVIAAFALQWEAMALGLRGRLGFNPCLATVGLGLVALTLYLFVGRFFHDARQRAGTWYGLTDRRALILYFGKMVCLNGVDLAEPGLKVVREDHAGGTGTLVFETTEPDPYWLGREGRSGLFDFGRPSWFRGDRAGGIGGTTGADGAGGGKGGGDHVRRRTRRAAHGALTESVRRIRPWYDSSTPGRITQEPE